MPTSADNAFDDLDLHRLWQRRSYKWSRYAAPVIAAWVAEMDYPVAPVLRAALQEMLERSDWGYPAHLEDLSLPQIVSHWARRTWDWPLAPQSVCLLGDALKGVELVLKTEVPPGSSVIIMPPVYYPFYVIPGECGHAVLEVPLMPNAQTWRMDFPALEAAMQDRSGVAPVRALLLCHPHNPTGTIFSDDELRSLAALCERYGLAVISDEVHGLLDLQPGLQRSARFKPFATYAAVDSERVFTVTSVAKAWNLAGMKAGLLLSSGHAAARRVRALPHRFKSGASLPGLITTEVALQQGQEWLADCNDYLRQRRDQVSAAVASWRLGHAAQPPYVPAQATYLAWIALPRLHQRLPPGSTLREHLLKTQNLALSDGSEFGAAYGAYIRLNFATSAAILGQILARIGQALDDVR